MAWTGVITDIGADNLSYWQSSGTTLFITKATVGRGTTENLRAATALTNEEGDATIFSSYRDGGSVTLGVQVTPFESSFPMTQVGIWAKIGQSGTPFLLSLHQNVDGMMIPAASGSPDFAFNIYLTHAISNQGNLTVNVDSSTFASVGYVHEKIIELAAMKEDTVLETTLSRGRKAETTTGDASFAFGSDVEASGNYSHAEGYETTASGNYSHSEGYQTLANALYAHAEGNKTSASMGSHSEGAMTNAAGLYCHTEGRNTEAYSECTHAEGDTTKALGHSSHAEGCYTETFCHYGHVEGYNVKIYGSMTHASGKYNVLEFSEYDYDTHYDIGDVVVVHSVNYGTRLYECISPVYQNGSPISDQEHWRGSLNVTKYAEIVGNGTESTPSNARTLDWNGNEYLKGNLYVNCDADSKNGKKVATKEYVDDKFTVTNESIATNVSISANSSVRVTGTVSKTGYSPIGLFCITAAGTNADHICPGLNTVKSSTGAVAIYAWNMSSTALSGITIAAFILWKKND